MPSMTNRICKYCGDPFQARTADVKRGWAKFCSKSCKAKEQERRTGQNARHIHSSMSEYDEANETAMADAEAGWDGHKIYF